MIIVTGILKLQKTRFYGKDKIKNETAQKVAVKTLKGILTLLHPYTPFITEEIWSFFRNKDDQDLIVSPWINAQEFTPDKDALHSFDIIKSTVSAIRMIRSKMNVPTNKRSDIIIRKGKQFESIIHDYSDIIKSLGSVDNITFSNDKEKPEKSATVVTHQMEIFVPLEGLIDFEIEISRLSKRLNELDKHVISIKQKLSNKNFVDRAPKEIVSHEKQKLDDMLVEYNLVKQNLDILI